MFPSLVGFGWNKVWHGDMVTYAMNNKPQNKLEKTIYKVFHQSFEQGLKSFLYALKPELAKIGYSIVKKSYSHKDKQEGCKYVSLRRLNFIYQVNSNIYYSILQSYEIHEVRITHPWLRFRSSENSAAASLWDNIVLPVDSSWWNLFFPPNGWNCHCWIEQVLKSDVDKGRVTVCPVPPISYVPYKNKRTGEIIQVPEGIHPGFQQNFFLIYDRLFNNT